MDPERLKLILAAAAAGLGGGFLLYSSSRRYRLWRQVGDTPTARVRSVAMGRAELKGLAGPGAPCAAPFSGRPCCWWRVTVEEERTVRTKNGTRKEWRRIHEASSDAPFSLDDGGDCIGVLPMGAEVDAPRLLDYTSGLFSLASAPTGPGAAAWLGGGLLAGRRRLREWRIDEKRPLYILGVVRPRREGGPAVGLGREGEPFLISTKDEAEILGGLRTGILLRLAGSLLLLLAALAAVLHLT